MLEIPEFLSPTPTKWNAKLKPYFTMKHRTANMKIASFWFFYLQTLEADFTILSSLLLQGLRCSQVLKVHSCSEVLSRSVMAYSLRPHGL